MERDDDLTHLLGQAADPPPPTPESFREILVRYRRGRTRALLVGLVVVALLGPAVGVAVGRATADRRTQVATAGSAESTGSDGSDGIDSEESMGFAWGGEVGSQVQGGPETKRLFLRTTTDGVTIRACLQENVGGAGDAQCATDEGPVPCPSPPSGCLSPPEAQLMAGLSNDGAVDPGLVPIVTAAVTDPLRVLQASYFGLSEGDPAAWVAVKADAGVETVRVRFADGTTDEMAPVDGYAVLAHNGVAPPTTSPAGSPEDIVGLMKAWLPQGTVEALDADGTVITAADLGSVPSPFSSECAPEGAPMPAPEGEIVPAAPAGVPAPVTGAPAGPGVSVPAVATTTQP